jgi:hypothetical protein
VIDTKLETKGNAVLQISLYSDLLSEIQAARPAFVVSQAPTMRGKRTGSLTMPCTIGT